MYFFIFFLHIEHNWFKETSAKMAVLEGVFQKLLSITSPFCTGLFRGPVHVKVVFFVCGFFWQIILLESFWPNQGICQCFFKLCKTQGYVYNSCKYDDIETVLISNLLTFQSKYKYEY